MTLPEEIWQTKLDTHLSYYPFAVRPFQSQLTQFLHGGLGLPIRESFFAIQFTLALCLGVFFYRFLRLLDFTRGWGLVGLAALMLSYPMLGAHFAPTHTWDDFWSYLFVTLTFIAVLRQRPITAGIFLTLGCFAREQIVVFWPLLLLWVWWSRRELNRFRSLLTLAMPIVLYGAYRWLVYQGLDLNRFADLRYNFETVLRFKDTLVSAWIAFGVLWLLALIGLLRRRRPGERTKARLIFWGVIMTLPLTVLLAVTAGKARETRLFFPPFVFVIPLSLYVLRDFWTRLRRFRFRYEKSVAGSLIVVLIGICYLATRWFFPQFDYFANSELRRQIAAIQFGLSASLVIGYVVLWWREQRAAKAIASR